MLEPTQTLPLRQQATTNCRVYLTNAFIEFQQKDIEQSIPSRFEQVVNNHPERIALKHKGHELTYSALNNKANCVAQTILEQRGTQAEAVTLLFEQGTPLITAILAVLKAGKFYVPLDPSYPIARNSYFLEDSQAVLLLTNNKNLALAQELAGHKHQVINIDELDFSQTYQNLNLAISADSLSYILYTSGSTGQPKGVVQNHRNVLHNIMKYTNGVHICRDDRLSLISSCSFAAAVSNLFGALLNGASLFPFDVKAEGLSKLVHLLSQEGITIYHSVPTVFRHFVGILHSNEVFPKLRLIKLGGETINRNDVDLYRQHFSEDCIFHVGLGSTEMNIIRQYFIDKNTPLTGNGVPVGYAVADTEILLLDDQGKEVSDNETGEIAIRSRYLSLGYWQRPDLNQAAFLTDPHNPHLRLYRTGDLGHLRVDGCLEHLGRKDFQVKIRGHRIEVNEVEKALLDFGIFKEAIVVARKNQHDEQSLIAYVTTSSKTKVSVISHELRHSLKEKLPDYMLPTAIVPLEAMPLTPSGKVDRHALPKPQAVDIMNGRVLVSETEQLLASLWSELLKTKVDRADADFFALGGHSLLAARLAVRIHETFQIEVPLRELFERPQFSQFASWLEQQQHGKPLPFLTPQPTNASQVLSYAQQRLWFLAKLDGQTATYNMPKALRLQGELNVNVLRQTFLWLVKRHHSLRQGFIEVDGETQVVLKPVFDPLQVTDLSHLPKMEQEQEIQRLMQAHALEPFDLSNDHLLRLQLLCVAKQTHILLLNMHHIISDGWSMGVMMREWGQAYNAFSIGQTPDLPVLSIQYSDYAIWQQQWLQDNRLEQHITWWQKQLKNAPPLLELPTDQPRPATQQHQGAAISLVIEEKLTKQLKQLAQTNGCTLYMLLLASLSLLLSRYSGQKDILIGTPVANRPQQQTENLIGLFLNTLVLRTQLSAKSTFNELLKQVRHTTLEAYAHQDIPFELLVEKLNPTRSLSYHPIFQVMLNLANVEQSQLQLSGLHIEPLHRENEGFAKFDLNLALKEVDGTLSGRLEYDANLFHAETIEFLGECFITLLTQAVEKADQPISQISLLSDAWYQRVAENKISQPTPTNRYKPFGHNEDTLGARFLRQAKRCPQQLAVVTAEKQLSYRQLEQQARQLVTALLETPSDTCWTALLCPHDSSMVTAIMGSLLAGHAYIPLDTRHPVERLRYILSDTGAKRLICTSETESLAKQLVDAENTLINLDTLHVQPAEILPPVKAETLAYLLYTSGSTGKPKGVMQNHRNVLHFIRQYTNQLHISQQDRLLQVASYAFDAAVMDIFGTLLNGATLYPFDLTKATLDECSSLIKEHKITIYHSTPSVFRLLMKSVNQPIEDVRLVVLGGEKVVASDIALHRQGFSKESLFVNGLGPTESTISAQCFINSYTAISRHHVPVGYAVKETTIQLIDNEYYDNQLFGEIVYYSPYLALGYWQHDSSAFTSDATPSSSTQNQRYYRTGDLGRLLPNGMLEVIDRVDQQIKLRGFRIELGEIEQVLCQHKMVKEAVVVLHEDEVDEVHESLAAYLTLTLNLSNSDTNVATLLPEYLKKHLPEYMIPISFTVLDSLPLTYSGKIDRQSLPAPKSKDAIPVATHVAPRNSLEHQLATIWQTVLKKEAIGIHDNFFELGGHSLLALTLFEQIYKVTGQQLPLTTLFQAPTIAQQAEMLQQHEKENQWDSLVTIQSKGFKPPLFLVPPAGGTGIGFRRFAHFLDNDQPIYTFQPLKKNGVAQPHTTIEATASHYIREMRRLQPEGPYRIGGMCFGGHVAWEMAQQLKKQQCLVDCILLLDPVPPANGPNWQRPTAPKKTLRYLIQRIYYHKKQRTLWGLMLKPRLHRLEKLYSKRRRDFERLAKIQLQAQLNYHVKPLAVKILLLQSEEFYKNRDFLQRWKMVSAGQLENVMIPNSTHRSLLRENDAHTQKMASFIQDYLAELDNSNIGSKH